MNGRSVIVRLRVLLASIGIAVAGGCASLTVQDTTALRPEQLNHLREAGIVVDDQEALTRGAHGFMPGRSTSKRAPPSDAFDARMLPPSSCVSS